MQSEAVQQYCSMVESLVTAEQSSKGASKETSTAQYQDIVVSDDGGTRTILLNRPSKYNAITFEVNVTLYVHCIFMYRNLMSDRG